jgi:hypothetical protein
MSRGRYRESLNISSAGAEWQVTYTSGDPHSTGRWVIVYGADNEEPRPFRLDSYEHGYPGPAPEDRSTASILIVSSVAELEKDLGRCRRRQESVQFAAHPKTDNFLGLALSVLAHVCGDAESSPDIQVWEVAETSAAPLQEEALSSAGRMLVRGIAVARKKTAESGAFVAPWSALSELGSAWLHWRLAAFYGDGAPDRHLASWFAKYDGTL